MKSLNKLAKEINTLVRQAEYHRSQYSELARTAGERLIEAKAQIPFGQFKRWVESRCWFTYGTANSYMYLARNWNLAEGVLKEEPGMGVRDVANRIRHNPGRVLRRKMGTTVRFPRKVSWQNGWLRHKKSYSMVRNQALKAISKLSVDEACFLGYVATSLIPNAIEQVRRSVASHAAKSFEKACARAGSIDILAKKQKVQRGRLTTHGLAA